MADKWNPFLLISAERFDNNWKAINRYVNTLEGRADSVSTGCSSTDKGIDEKAPLIVMEEAIGRNWDDYRSIGQVPGCYKAQKKILDEIQEHNEYERI